MFFINIIENILTDNLHSESFFFIIIDNDNISFNLNSNSTHPTFITATQSIPNTQTSCMYLFHHFKIKILLVKNDIMALFK